MNRLALYSVLLLTIALLAPSSKAFALDIVNRGDRYFGKLVLTDAARDKEGNLYVIVNTWTSDEKNLVKIRPDHTIDKKFRLARLEDCCTVDPYAVDVDSDGNIFILTHQEWINDFILAKYGPDGELDEDFADEGMLHYAFESPIDLEVRFDGAVYVLDMDFPEVYAIDNNGTEVMPFVYENYSLIKPAKITMGSSAEMYIFDQFDPDFTEYDTGQGIVALHPNGNPVYDYGTGWEGVNSGYHTLVFASAVVDVDDTLWVLGTYANMGPLSGAFHYDTDGELIEQVALESLMPEEVRIGGIIAADEGGFILFEVYNLDLTVMRYDRKGNIVEKFSVEVFKRSL